MRQHSPGVIERPEKELLELRQRVQELKRKLNAVVVAHNYQRIEVQDVADFVGDSLELSRKATEVDADVIVFCGVDFMAESAAILNPLKTVLLAESSACCPMAEMIDADDLKEWKGRYPDAAVVCYVNTSAAVKAGSDICCTSANAVKIVESVKNKEILFVPDKNLGSYVSRYTSKKMILYPGYCIVHHRLNAKQVLQARELFPGATVLVHPECRPEVIDQADAALSTSQMIQYAREKPGKIFLIGTEEGLLYRLRQENPGKTFVLISNALICPNMKRTTLETVVRTMEERRNIITIPEEVRLKAKRALDGMLAIR
ncbi:MAG: quinolinate synthase NadA [Dehalococcoidia bacterium]|nr:quinolinate synthase NadA [Dehalococcoidia bacterium]